MTPLVRGQPITILCAGLLLLPLLGVRAQGDYHLLHQVLFCQPGQPVSGLLKMFDEDQMFHYNFQERSTSAWLGDFQQWSGQAFPDAQSIASDLAFCNTFRHNLTTALEDIMPEARGGTLVTVFPALPLRIGEPNTLICAINDVYPPALTITWVKNSKVLSRELNSYGYFSMHDLSFQAFSYLNITPKYGDNYSCNVQVAGDNSTIIYLWVPDYPVPSPLLENALCGLGFALGIFFLLLSFMFFCLAKKLSEHD